MGSWKTDRECREYRESCVMYLMFASFSFLHSRFTTSRAIHVSRFFILR